MHTQGMSSGCRWQQKKGNQIAARQTRSVVTKIDASAWGAVAGVSESKAVRKDNFARTQ